MNFDYGDLLTRSLQITWRNKMLWILSALPMLISFLVIPVFLLPTYFHDAYDLRGDIESVIVTAMFVSMIVLMAASFAVAAYSMSAATLGVLRAEKGEGSLAFLELLRDGGKYFWRVLGVMLVINLTIGMAFTLFFLCVFVSIVVTMGMASICFQPIMIIIAPLSFFAVVIMESAESAVVVDDLGVMDALKRAFALVRTHFWKYALITLIIYLAGSILSSFLLFPFMVPFFGLGVFAASSFPGMEPRFFPLIITGFMCILFPLMYVIRGVTLTFIKSALSLAYLQLTRAAESQVMPPQTDVVN